MDPSGGGEFAAIERIRAALTVPPPGQSWIGDDAAVLEGDVLFAADAAVAGVHADLSLLTLADLGWRAMVANLSDIAAMGGVPVATTVTVAGPPDTDLDELYEGIAAAARRFGCPVVGGDLTTAGGLVVSVAILGDGRGDPPPVRRAGARPGDRVWVTGPLGGSAAGLRLLRAGASSDLCEVHRRPVPRLAAGGLARRAGATAMIDVSDGFGADLGHVLDASGVGADLDGIPVAPGATDAEALGGGEDYELVFTAAPEAAVAAAFAEAGIEAPLDVGVCTGHDGDLRLRGERLPRSGWQHGWQ